MTRPLLDQSVRAIWLAEAAAGRPPPFRLVAEEEWDMVVDWWHEEAFVPCASMVDPTSPFKNLVNIEATRGGGKSSLLQLLRLYLVEWVLPFTQREGLPVRQENRAAVLFGRDEAHIKADILGPMARLIVERAPWLRTDQWLSILEDADDPSPDGKRTLEEMKSKPSQRWESLRLDLANGVTIRTRTMRQSVRGIHCFYADIDDPLIESNAHESSDIMSLIQGAILPALEPGGLLLVVGTPQLPGDLFDLMAADKSWQSSRYPALDMDDSRGYAAKNLARHPGRNFSPVDLRCLWPDRLSWAALEQARGSTPDSEVKFQREYLLERSTPETRLVRDDDLLAARDFTLSYQPRPPGDLEVSGGCDPSGRKKDAAGFVVGYVQPDAVRVPLHIGKLDVAPHLPMGEGELSVVQEINDLSVRYGCYRWTIESNGAQAIFGPLARQMNSSIRPEHFQLGANKHTVENGWLGLRTIFRNRLVRLPYMTEDDRRITDEFIFQVRGIQFIDGRIEEDRRRKNDLVSAFFLWLKSCEQTAAVYSATALVAQKRANEEQVAGAITIPGTAPSDPMSFLRGSPNSPNQGELSRHTQQRRDPWSPQALRDRLSRR